MATASTSDPQSTPTAQKFGTFLGVYTPSVLTILGLIMYLRFGWVVGNVGLGLTLLIVLLASSITFITSLSASAISTNMRVGVGGEYFMISRSLGLELGGAIGIPLFLCRTLSITFYSFGLAESLLLFWPASWGEMPGYTIQLLTAGVIVLITAISGKSAGLALKLQIPIMVAVGLSLVALVLGVAGADFQAPEMVPTYRTAPEGFWYVFAVFFPAVTGFTAGIGMSGDLKDPRSSIPKGTLAAVGTGAFIYLTIPVLLAVTMKVSAVDLAQPGIVWVKVAVLGAWLVYPGVWGAILSSAFGSVLGGPRVLQSLAMDGLAPRFMGKLSKTGQPTIATWISGGIALAAVALGGLNAVAQFVSMLFLTLYVLINSAAAVESLVGDPSYRPTIKVPWYVSILGAVGAVAVMFKISPWAGVAAVITVIALYAYLRRRAMKKRWGDVRAGLWVALVRFALVQLKGHGIDPRNWRPHILLFVSDLDKRLDLARLASWFNQNRGVVTVCRLTKGNLLKAAEDTEGLRTEMDQALAREGIVAFAEVNVVQDFEHGLLDVTQANGIGGLSSNTIMFGWPSSQDRMESMLRVMRAAAHTKTSTIIARPNWALEPGQEQCIDVWWRGKQRNGDLLLLLAHLLTLNTAWRRTRICLRTVVDHEDQRDAVVKGISALLEECRIGADTEVVVKPEDKSVMEVMHERSRGASVVLLGLDMPEPGTEPAYAASLLEMAEGFSTAIFVRNAGHFVGELI